MYDPEKSGCQIGVILYQQAFFIAKANYDMTKSLTGRAPYPTGGLQLSWEGDAAAM